MREFPTTWLKRWRKIGYRELWYRHYGGAHEGDKGCVREYDLMLGVTTGWRDAYLSEQTLRLEADELLRKNDIEPPSDTQDRLWKERINSINNGEE